MSTPPPSGFTVAIMGLILLLPALFIIGDFVLPDNESEAGEDAAIYKICSDDYPVGFWFVEYDTYRDYHVAERMTETEYAKYCVK